MTIKLHIERIDIEIFSEPVGAPVTAEVARAAAQRPKAVTAKRDISPQAAEIMRVLAYDGPLTIREIGECLNLPPKARGSEEQGRVLREEAEDGTVKWSLNPEAA